MRLSDVGPGKQPVEGEARRRGENSLRNDVDAVSVVIESRFIEQRWTDRVGGMNHGAVGRISENVADRGNVVAAPLRGPVGLRNLLGNPVPEY